MRDELYRWSTSPRARGVYKGANVMNTLPKASWDDVARALERNASSRTQSEIKALLRDAKTVRALYLTNTEAGYIVNTSEGEDFVVEVKFACTNVCGSKSTRVPAYKAIPGRYLVVNKLSEGDTEAPPCGWWCVDRDVGWLTRTTTLSQDDPLVQELAKAFREDPEQVIYVMSREMRRQMQNRKMSRSIYKVIIDRVPHFFQLMLVSDTADEKKVYPKKHPLIVLNNVNENDDDEVLDSLCHYALSPNRQLRGDPSDKKILDEAARDAWYRKDDKVYVSLPELVELFQNCPVPDFDPHSSTSVAFPLAGRHDQFDRSGWHARLWPARENWVSALFAGGKRNRLFVPVRSGAGVSGTLRPLAECEHPEMSTSTLGTLVGHRGDNDGLCVRVRDYGKGDIDRDAKLPHHDSLWPWGRKEKSLKYVSLDDCVCVLRRAPSPNLEVCLLCEALPNEWQQTTHVSLFGNETRVQHIFERLGESLAHMHLQGVYHGDVGLHTVLAVRDDEHDDGYRLKFVGFGTNTKLFNIHNYYISWRAGALIMRKSYCVGAYNKLTERVSGATSDALINVSIGYEAAKAVGFETREPHLVKMSEDPEEFEIQYHFERHAKSYEDPLLDISPVYDDDTHIQVALVPYAGNGGQDTGAGTGIPLDNTLSTQRKEEEEVKEQLSKQNNDTFSFDKKLPPNKSITLRDGNKYVVLSTLRRNAWGALQRKYSDNHNAYRLPSEPNESKFLVTAMPGVVVTCAKDSLMTAKTAPIAENCNIRSCLDGKFRKGAVRVRISVQRSLKTTNPERLRLEEVNTLFREMETSETPKTDYEATLHRILWMLRHMSLAEYFRFQCVLGEFIQESSIESSVLSRLCTLALDITQQWTTNPLIKKNPLNCECAPEERHIFEKFLINCNFKPIRRGELMVLSPHRLPPPRVKVEGGLVAGESPTSSARRASGRMVPFFAQPARAR